MSKHVMVEAASIFKMKYCIEVPDEVEDGQIFDYVDDKVKRGDVIEFTQVHEGESVTNYEIITEDEIIEQFRDEEPYFVDWEKERILKMVTPIGFDHKEYDKEAERKWRMNTN